MTDINFRTKISVARPHKSGDNLNRALESDRGRIINSAPIRRLQQKTQVFPLERNSAVRSRLTHSMEVQQVGRFIVQTIFDTMNDNQIKTFGLDSLERAIESIVEIACLMHDMGNPPFGHSGEDAINRWFEHHIDALHPLATIHCNDAEREALRRELVQFEGNAQVIRLVHSLHRFNLTYCQSATVLKYTRPATLPKCDIPDNRSYLMKKVGFYRSEQSYIEAMQQALSMQAHSRHPLCYIMEAADDISYCLADLEDAVEKRIITLEKLTSLLSQTYARLEPENRPVNKSHTFSEVLDNVLENANRDEISKTHDFFIRLRVGIIHPLVRHAAQQFIAHIEQIYHGTFNRALLEDGSQFHAVAKTFKQVAIQHVFNHPEVETLEIQGYKIIGGLLDEYRPLLDLDADSFMGLTEGSNRQRAFEQRLFNKLPNKHVRAYLIAMKAQPLWQNPVLNEFYFRCRLVQDYISGMTDQFAFDEYKALKVSD